MRDKNINFIVNKCSLFLNYLWKIGIPTKKTYQLYHRIIISMISEELKLAKANMNSVQLISEYFENKVWVMWWQGLESAPQLVINNINNLRSIFGSDNVIIITHKNFENYTNIEPYLYKKLQNGDITFALWSDIVRYNLLLNNGGLWVDSTVIISKLFLKYFNKNKKDPFISLCNNEDDYRYISNNKWTGWLLGGKRNYELFRFVVSFFNIYYKRHTNQIDYFLVDDAVFFFYENDKSFKNLINNQLLEWDPYLFARNYTSSDIADIIDLFKKERQYSVQKFSNKINLTQPQNTLYSFLNRKKND
mgnify:CR=1 FL=1